jgi:hypothetical protein
MRPFRPTRLDEWLIVRAETLAMDICLPMADAASNVYESWPQKRRRYR